MKEYKTDCYNKKYLCGEHDDPNFISIFHIANISLPSNPLNRVEVIIRDHDDINNPCFYILTEDRSKELYKVSLFDNSYTKGLSKEDKVWINEFIQLSYTNYPNKNPVNWIRIFDTMRNYWTLLNIPDNDDIYDEIDPPVYI